MARYGYGYGEYVSVAEKKEKARKLIQKYQKKGVELFPVEIQGRTIARSWWAKSWNQNLESYADFSNRISRGKSYLTSGLVINLEIKERRVDGLVAGTGSKAYSVQVYMDPLLEEDWKALTTSCSRRVEDLAELVGGRFPKELQELFTARPRGLFPRPDEIHFSCSCPDIAYMCKHVSAVLYGIGARFDEDPLLFFKLRGIPFEELLKESVETKMTSMLENADKKTSRTISDEEMQAVFGFEL